MVNHRLKVSIFLGAILLLGACNSKEKISEKHLPSNAKISTKFLLINFNLCTQNKIRPFSKMKAHDCMFVLDEETYTIKRKYILDKNGKINSYWSYLPEGPDIHSFEELKRDPKLFEYIGGKNLSVKLVGDIIIDGQDTLKIEKVWLEEQLISVKTKTQPSEIVTRQRIYQYE